MSNIQRNNPFKNERAKFLTDPVFLIGNGKSREGFDLEKLRPLGTIMGCNALYRDFTPDVLMAIDSKMLNEITKAKYGTKEGQTAMIITPHNRSVAVPNSYTYKTSRFNTTGAFAMRLISNLMEPEKCYMLGMDAYPGNMYDGTTNYAVHTLKNFNGVHRFYEEILRQSKKTVFINVNIEDRWPPTCENTNRYKFMTYEEFTESVLK